MLNLLLPIAIIALICFYAKWFYTDILCPIRDKIKAAKSAKATVVEECPKQENND